MTLISSPGAAPCDNGHNHNTRLNTLMSILSPSLHFDIDF